MKRFFPVFLSFTGLCFLLSAVSLQAQPAPDKVALIEELLKASHAEDQMQENLNLILAQIGEDFILDIAARGAVAADQGVAPEMQTAIYTQQLTKWDQFVGMVERKAKIGEMTRDVALPIYDKNFSRGELKAIVGYYKNPKVEDRFYRSRAGRKFGRMEEKLSADIIAGMRERLEPIIQECLDEVFPKSEP